MRCMWEGRVDGSDSGERYVKQGAASIAAAEVEARAARLHDLLLFVHVALGQRHVLLSLRRAGPSGPRRVRSPEQGRGISGYLMREYRRLWKGTSKSNSVA